MLPKYFTFILRFYSILPESRDLLGFDCRASIVYNIMLLALKSEITGCRYQCLEQLEA